MDPTPPGFFVPLRKTYPSVWNSIRRKLLKEFGAVCQICGHVGKEKGHIECHEVYSYPSSVKIALDRVILLCWRCHAAVHFERSKNKREQISVADISAHYCSVNGNLSDELFRQDQELLFRTTKSIQDFYGGPHVSVDLDYGPFQELVYRYEERKARDVKEGRFRGIVREDIDIDWEMLPEHECAYDTAMWRDTFG